MSIKKDLEQQSGFFRTDEQGKMLFYPWGYPGESFYVEESKKKQITVFFYIIASLFILSVMKIAYLPRDGITELDTSLLLFTINSFFFFVFYCGFMRFFTRNLKFYVDEKKTIPKGTIQASFIFLSLQILFTTIGVYYNHGSPLFTSMLVLVNILFCILLIFLIIWTIRNKGYYFTKIK